MKEIKLTQGKVALVDDDMFEYLNQWKWFAHKGGNKFYAIRNEPIGKNTYKHFSMHKQIMNTPPGMVVDHINHDGLNNLKSNLRICTHAENIRNSRTRKDNTSGAKGVCWSKHEKKWRVEIKVSDSRIHIGYFQEKKRSSDCLHRSR